MLHCRVLTLKCSIRPSSVEHLVAHPLIGMNTIECERSQEIVRLQQIHAKSQAQAGGRPEPMDNGTEINLCYRLHQTNCLCQGICHSPANTVSQTRILREQRKGRIVTPRGLGVSVHWTGEECGLRCGQWRQLHVRSIHSA